MAKGTFSSGLKFLYYGIQNKHEQGRFRRILHKILSKYHKDNQIDLMPILQRAYSIIKEDAQINLNDDYKIIQKGKRVSICFDGRYYFLMLTINGKPFAPAKTKEELMEDYKAIEENAE